MAKHKAGRKQNFHQTQQHTMLAGYKQKAEKQHRAGDVESAIDTLEKARNLAPNDTEVLYYLGKWYIENKQPKLGMENLEAILDKAPNHYPAIVEMGLFYLKQGAIHKAYPLLVNAAEIEPNHQMTQASLGGAHQRKGELAAAIQCFRKALTFQIKSPMHVGVKKKKEDFNKPETEAFLWATLEMLASRGIHAFPAFGTLLGIVRTGELLPFDKDLDVCLPFSELERACKILQKKGWKEVSGSFGLMNPRAFFHPEKDVSMDLGGVLIDKTKEVPVTGFWIKGVPKRWNWFAEFPNMELVKRETPQGGKAWLLKEPEAWLESLYGDWKTPDKNFDTLVAAKNLCEFSLLAQCYAYSRIYSNWVNGKKERALALARHALARNPEDLLIRDAIVALEK